MKEGFVIVKEEELQELVDNFYQAYALANEVNLYEFPEGYETMEKMKKWTTENFGRNLEKSKINMATLYEQIDHWYEVDGRMFIRYKEALLHCEENNIDKREIKYKLK